MCEEGRLVLSRSACVPGLDPGVLFPECGGCAVRRALPSRAGAWGAHVDASGPQVNTCSRFFFPHFCLYSSHSRLCSRCNFVGISLT